MAPPADITTSEARTLSVSVERSPDDVYRYVSDPRHLPVWAAGLAKSVEHRDGQWVVDSGDGEWIVEFVDENPYGVADHLVRQPDGSTQLNPMRVLANGDGSEITFTLFRAEAGADDEVWALLQQTILTDLEVLRDVLESAD